jgi:phosphate-selective porin OprO/OprP
MVSAQEAPKTKVIDKAPILIENVRPWDAGSSAEKTVDVLIIAGTIERVSSDPIELPNDAIDVDGEGRFIVGSLVVGEPANVIVIDEDPSADLTMLTDPGALFLVVRDGEIEAGEFSDDLESANTPILRAIDPSRYRIIRVKKDPWYTYRSKRFTASFVAGALLDQTSFNSNDKLESQVGDLNPYDSGEVRTVRLGVGGLFNIIDKEFAYILVGSDQAFDQGYNAREDRTFEWIDWALATDVYGATLKVGKAKELFSHDRQLLLVDQPFMERPMAISALLPSRNTGITLQNTAFGERMSWAVGSYFDMLGDRDKPFEDIKTYTTRITALPYVGENEKQLLHVGLGYRYADTDSGVLRFSTGPETIFSPDFVDTGEFAASNASWTGLELGYKHGPIWMISEYIRTDVNANNYNDPTFDGFHVSGTWALTGEERSYMRRQGLFGKLTPLESVRTGGIGAWELVARYSEVDLSDGLIEGGDMSRVSVGVNWWPTRDFKGTIQYGWIDLDRFGISSSSNILQLRGAMMLGF